MTAELVDAYDESLNVTGAIDRETAHEKGVLHRTVHCWFIDSDFVYFQIRGKEVAFPELLDVTAGGHLSSGETVEDAVRRETEEELGISVSLQDLVYVGQNRFAYHTNDTFVREFSDVYFTRAKKKFNCFFPNPSELTGIAAIPFTAGREVIRGRIYKMPVRVLLANPKRRIYSQRTIRRGSFVPSILDYFVRVLELGELFGKGIPGKLLL